MFDNVLSAWHLLSDYSLLLREGLSVIIPILQVGKQRLGEVK